VILAGLGLETVTIGRVADTSVLRAPTSGMTVRSWLLMRHLLGVQRLCELPGHDDTESVQDPVSALGGECRPEVA
jgi:hypothetical protein